MNQQLEPPHSNQTDLLMEVFIKLFKCDRQTIEVQEVVCGHSVLIRFQNEVYQLDTQEQLLHSAKQMLTHEDMAQLIDPAIWIEVAEQTHTNPEFYLYLCDQITSEDERSILNLALNMTNTVNDKKGIFWKALHSLDNQGTLYGKAITAAARTFDLDSVAEELVEVQLFNGSTVFNKFDSGIFETVWINNANNEPVMICIYSQDESLWNCQ